MITNHILQNLKPWYQYSTNIDTNNQLLNESYNKCLQLYVDECSQLSYNKQHNASTSIKVCYTAMHGVGAPFTESLFKAYYLPSYIPTIQQHNIDPDFPTVKFPNPEEGQGALKLAIDTAEQHQCNLILANDPDADRLAVAELQQDTKQWHILNGNEIAILFADYLWSMYKQHNRQRSSYKDVYMVNSTVSSKFIQSMSQVECFSYIDTLTGFKWLGNKCYELVQQGNTVLLAYEVEIGFLPHTISYDKDGVRSAAVFYELAAVLQQQYNTTCVKRLQQLYEKYGYFVGKQSYFIVNDIQHSQAIFHRLRDYNRHNDNNSGNKPTLFIRSHEHQFDYPSRIGQYDIRSIRDITYGIDTAGDNYNSILPRDSGSQMIMFFLTNDSVITLRNSGTEPKLKYYIECKGKTKQEAQLLCDEIANAVVNELIQPQKYGLIAKE